jgi:hypothetical protein
MIADELRQPINHCPDLPPVPIIAVHDNPPRVSQRGNGVAHSLEPRILIGNEAGQYG